MLARVTRIKEQGSADDLVKRFMRVAENYDGWVVFPDSFLKSIRQGMRIHDVVEEKFLAIEFDDFGYPVAHMGIIRIPRHCGHWSNLLELSQDLWKSDIPSVQNMLNARQQIWQL